MPRVPARVFCPALLTLLSFCVPAIAGDAPWIEVRSEHFTVVTDAGEKNGRHVADRFEQMRAVFGLLFGRERINQPVPLEIVAFRSAGEMRQYCPIFQGKVVELSGFFQQAEDKDFIAVDMGREESWQTVLHEYAHVLLNSNYQATAPWFDEGFAEYLSSMKVSSNEVEIGQTIPEAALLAPGARLRLLDLFQVQHHSETYNVSGTRREMFYVESWLVVHYLFDNNRVQQAATYFSLVNDRKMPVQEAVREAFGVPIDRLENNILDYLYAGKVKVLRYTGKDKVALTYTATVRPLDPLETRAVLADLHLHSQDYVPAAIKEFEEVLKADPNQLEAQSGLGYAYLRTHQLDKAGEHFSAAARLGSKDPRVYYYSAVLIQESGGSLASPEIARGLWRAIELNPQYADAHELLGESLMSAGRAAEGEQELRRAIELSPRNEMYRLNYAAGLMNEQKVDQAQALLESIANGGDPQAAQLAQENLRRIAEYRLGDSRLEAEEHASLEKANREEEARDGEQAGAGKANLEPAKDTEPSSIEVAIVPAQYLKGTIVAVDCSSRPAAVLTVLANAQAWKLAVPDIERAAVTGADKFSCSWRDRKAGIHYRPTGANQGSVVSVEMQ